MTSVPDRLRRAVWERAGGCCEYCLLDAQDSFIVHEVDHIIAEKHRGTTDAENLCLSCFDCNRFKGSDIGSIDPETGRLIPLFNPRTQTWAEHFRLAGSHIEPLTPEGRVTVFLLQLNSDEQIARRNSLIPLNRYPCQR